MNEPQTYEPHGAAHGTLSSYVTGFVLSLGITLVSYLFAVNGVVTGDALIGSIMLLAVIGLIVQLVFFFHFGKKSQNRWNLAMLALTIMIIGILAGGSLWVMYHLNYNMTPAQMNTYMNSQDAL